MASFRCIAAHTVPSCILALPMDPLDGSRDEWQRRRPIIERGALFSDRCGGLCMGDSENLLHRMHADEMYQYSGSISSRTRPRGALRVPHVVRTNTTAHLPPSLSTAHHIRGPRVTPCVGTTTVLLLPCVGSSLDDGLSTIQRILMVWYSGDTAG